jgi:putative peptide zinc metalloprotease protein
MTTTLGPAPRRAGGIQLHGPYAGSGYREPRYLVVRADGQAVHLTRLLYLVLEAIDGSRAPVAAATEVSSHLERELTAEGLLFLVDTKLRPLGLLTADRNTEPDHAPVKADPVLSVRLHTMLIPAKSVRILGGLLAPLFGWPVIAVITLALAATDAWLLTNASLPAAFESMITRPDLLLAVGALMALASLFHELGHAAGCHRGGGRPGRIGVGLYLIFPAFYTDVTDAYRLSRRGRLRTDLGGVYFSGIASLAAGAGHLATGSPILLLVAFLGQIGLVQQLLPVVRMDGYFILGDLTGIPDLFGRIKPMLLSLLPGRGAHPDVKDLRPTTRVVVIIWVLVVVPILAAGLILFILQLPTILSSTVSVWQQQLQLASDAWAMGAYSGLALAVIASILGSLPVVGVGMLVLILSGKMIRSTRSRMRNQITRRPPGRGVVPFDHPTTGTRPTTHSPAEIPPPTTPGRHRRQPDTKYPMKPNPAYPMNSAPGAGATDLRARDEVTAFSRFADAAVVLWRV